ncbi:CTR-like PK [Haematococcus lacustris]|uniref:CTR-like PK n=1 Tax=Haematococcus lacustris TaxID=44745 RepID=A0A6A0A0F7_HAELA|nr:CTR-like PK [Haematococcus lacustris]
MSLTLAPPKGKPSMGTSKRHSPPRSLTAVEKCRGSTRGCGYRDVAVKLFNQQNLSDGDLRTFQQEVLVLSRTNHPSVVGLYGASLQLPNLCLVEELCDTCLEKWVNHLLHTPGCSPARYLCHCHLTLIVGVALSCNTAACWILTATNLDNGSTCWLPM